MRLAAAAFADSDAVRFFEYRAQLVLPSFRLADANAPAVVQICRRLDGLPLAIELAAAQVRMLSLDRLAGVFATFSRCWSVAPARPRAATRPCGRPWTGATTCWMRTSRFRRLAVFAGGFTLTAAERVTAGGSIRPQHMLELLTRLADKSLLRVDHMGSSARYHLFGTVREYALERLAGAAEERTTRRAHLRYFVGLVELVAPGSIVAMGVLWAWNANWTAWTLRCRTFAWRWSSPAIAEMRMRRSGSLGRWGALPTFAATIRRSASGWTPPSWQAGMLPVRCERRRCWAAAAWPCCSATRPAVRRLEAALRLYRELGDTQGVASALQVLGSVAREQGRYARAMELHAESLSIAEAAGDQWAVASAHGYLGFACSAAVRLRAGDRGVLCGPAHLPASWVTWRESPGRC